MHRPVVVVVAIAALLFALVPAPQAAGADPGTSRSPDRRLIERLDPERLSLHSETGWVRFLGGSTAKPLRVAGGAAEPLTAADAFLGTYGPLFGLTDPGAELRARPTRNPVDRLSVVRFDQLYQGIPVLAGELAVQVDKKGAVLAASGEISPDLGLDIVPVLTADQAAAEAISASATANGVAASTLDATPPTLAIYDPRLLGSPGLPVPRLVWRTDVGSAGGISVRDFVAVDAMRGGIALIFSDLETALERRICDRNNTRNDASCTGPYVRVEGGPASGIADADAAYDFLGDAYAFYASRFGRDSVDNAGLPIVATVRFCTTDASEGCPYQNAYWDGSVDQLFFGAGYLVDDVTAHELSHGVTHFESRFYYVYQSGALSEMMSDVFGEFVDLTNGRGNDSPSARWLIGEEMAGGAIRNMANPPAYNQPDRMRSSLYYSQGPADDDHDNGGVHYNSGVGNKAAYLLTDGGTFNGHVVGSIGLDKTARIFYVANTTLLTSGSDYADLYDDLQQACTASIGTAGITSGDCVQVGEAVAATEMNLQPTTGAAAPEAPVCAASVSPVALFSDDFEAGGANWVSGTITGGNAWEPIPDHMYATSGTHHLWGINLPVTADSYAAMKTAVPVPAGQPYLRFAHAYEFHTADASNRDGGVVEYTVNNGTTWLDAGPLVVDNPYNGTIAAGYGNPLAGREGFTRWSYGYTSSRLSLASLVGQTVRFRFRVGTDVSGGALGWLIDDVRIYNCDTTPPSNTAPTISNIPDQTTPVNTAEGPLAFTVGDAETDPGSLDVTGSSSNTTLVPNASITFGGSGASRTVTVTPATGQVGTATITVTVSDGDLTAQDTFVQTVTPTDTGITASGVGVSYATFYPYKDGYRDTVAIRGTPGEPLSVTVKVYNGAGKKVRSWSLASRTDPWSISWNGTNASGTRLPAGKYKVTQALRDEAGNTKTYTSYTTISNKRLYWSTATITKNGNQLSAYGDPGSGSVSASKSSYSRGVLLTSGASWVAVRYSFTLRAAKIYEPLRFKVLGRSPNGRRGQEGLWNSTYGSSNDVGAYDRKTIGPDYRWYTIKGASSTHRSGRSTCGLVYVEYLGGTQKFDVSKVRLVYRYAVLR